jgi:hypothetical protein
MRLEGKQLTAFVLAGILVVISGAQLDETFSAIHFWWRVGHPSSADFVVPNWWTHYTIASALFAPAWLIFIGAALFLSRRWPLVAVVTLSSFLIIEPLSCVSAGSWIPGSDGFLGLAELPFAQAERSADWEHLARIDALLKRVGDDAGAFPTSEQGLTADVGNLALEPSPYVQGGKRIAFDLQFVLNQGVPYTTNPERPSIVYYTVNPDGRQFVLTISGLNAPTSARSSMMKAEAFTGEKQPWSGLLATEEALYPK